LNNATKWAVYFDSRKSSTLLAQLVCCLTFAILLFPKLSDAQVLPPENIYQKILPSVMTLRVENVRGEIYVGTGFLALDKNIAVTAWHVVSDATNVTAKFSDGRIVNVTGIVDRDEAHDLALVRLDSGGPEAPVSTPPPLVGSRAYVIGAPKGFDFSMTDGLVSQIQKINGDDQYQVSCPISGGNSGGPVLNDRGQVIGIVAWTKTDAQNLSFAIPAAWLTHLHPGLAPVPWKTINQISFTSVKRNIIPVNSANVSEPQESLSALKRLLKADAGRQLTVTVSEGDTEKSFNFVVPKDFVK
jgi:S1-C subfamily serine protease